MRDQTQKQVELLKQIEALEKIAKQYLSKEALVRYGSLKSAHPEKAIHSITIIVRLIQQGQLKEILSDDDFRSLLIKMEKSK